MSLTNANEAKDVQMCETGEGFEVVLAVVDFSGDTFPAFIIRSFNEGIAECARSNFGRDLQHQCIGGFVKVGDVRSPTRDPLKLEASLICCMPFRLVGGRVWVER